jgi:hypothetical protein
MAKHECELFGVVHYNPELTYYELYEVEENCILQLQDILDAYGAMHLDFWGAGDSLQLECGLAEYDPDILHDILDEVAAMLRGKLSGRVVCVKKDLTALSVFQVAPGRWTEEEVSLSGAPA